MKLNWKIAPAALLALMTLSVSAHGQTDAQDPYAAVMKRDFGTAIDEMTAIEKDIEAATPAQYPAFEDHLIAILTAPDATKPGKQFACQMLRIVGSPKCIPAVSALLTDEQLSHMARYVLLPMHGPAPGDALRTALGQTQGTVRIGIVNSLGDRRDIPSLKAIAALVTGTDEPAGRAALNALGKIGGVPAADALDRLKAPGNLHDAWSLAYLRVALGLASAGDLRHADKMLSSLLKPEHPTPVRAAALYAYALDQREKSVPLIVESLSSKDPLIKRAATTAVIGVPGHAATVAFTRKLPGVAAEVKPTLLAALAARGDGVGLSESVNKLTADTNEPVRTAAVLALGRVGNAASVSVLTALLNDPTVRRDAARSLAEIKGAGVMEAMLQKADTGAPEARAAVLKVLAQRGDAAALPSLRKALADPDRTVRGAGIAGLSALGTAEDLKLMAARVLAPSDDGEREEAGGAMTAIGLRIPDETTRAAPALQAYSGATPAAKVQLLAVLASLGGDKALQGVQAALAEETEVHKAAIRGLAEWPSSAPMAALRTAAKEDADRSSRTVALRGYIRMIAGSGQQPDAKAQAYKEAIAMAERPDEKRQALAGLADVSGVASLKIVEPFLDDPDVKREAYVAYERIAESLAGSQPETAKEALKRVAENAGDSRLQNRAKTALDKIK